MNRESWLRVTGSDCFILHVWSELQGRTKIFLCEFLKALELALAQPLNAHLIFDIALVSSPRPSSFEVDALRMPLPLVRVVWFALQLHSLRTSLS